MSPWLLRLGPPVGAAYLRFVRLTSRYRVAGGEGLDENMRKTGHAVWCCWHNRLLGAIALHARLNLGAVISRSGDGELIARAVERLGYTTLRGSTSRGGSEALRAVLKHIRKGFGVVFTPDGPRGPRYQVQQGAAFAAVRAGLPLVPVGVGATRKIVFRSWDRFQLPLPFGTVQVVYGPPLTFAPDEDLEQARERIRVALTAATEEADRLLGVVSP